MELHMSTFVIISIAFFFAGIIDAVSGGGGLLTLPTFMLTEFPVHLIAGTNQCSCLLGGFTSLFKFIKSGHVYRFTAVIAGINAIIGSVLGARLNLILPAKYLQVIMIVILPFVAVFILANKNLGEENKIDTLTTSQLAVRSALIGFLLGGYTGFYGAGGGAFILLAFTTLTRLDLITSSGNAKVCSVAAGFTASITFALSHSVVWPIVFCAAAFNIAGNYIGASLAIKKGATVIRPMFVIVLLLLFGKLITSLIF